MQFSVSTYKGTVTQLIRRDFPIINGLYSLTGFNASSVSMTKCSQGVFTSSRTTLYFLNSQYSRINITSQYNDAKTFETLTIIHAWLFCLCFHDHVEVHVSSEKAERF